MESLRHLPFLVETPFVVSDSIFVNPKYRGTRLPPMAETDPTERREMFLHKPIRVHDARSLGQAPRLDVEGFQLFEAPIRLDFGDRKLVTTRFYEYCADLVKAATGCLAARVLQHEFRRETGEGEAGRTAYARMVHADVCPYVEDVLRAPEGRHFGLFNVWRNIDPAREIECMPLALCDVTTVAGTDIVYANARRRTEPKTRLVDCRLVHDTGQGWYYFPRMTADEALIFKQYDTRQEDASRRATFHVAFKDPTTQADASWRQTIEARVLAIFRENDPERTRRRARFQAEVPMVQRDGTISTWRHEEMVDWRNG